MTSKRLGIFIIAFVAAWSLTGLNWMANLDHDVSVSFGVTEAHASGDPDDYSGAPEGPPGGEGDVPDEPNPPEDEYDGRDLWSRLIDLVESLVGDE